MASTLAIRAAAFTSLLVAGSVLLLVSCGGQASQAGQPADPTLTPGLPASGFPIKSAGEVLAVSANDRVTLKIERGNRGTQAIWDEAIVLIRLAERLVFTWTAFGTLPPGVSGSRLNELRPGERISFVLHPDSWSSSDESFAVSLVGRPRAVIAPKRSAPAERADGRPATEDHRCERDSP